MNILITVCGRSGSKGVKNKNIREFMGESLIKYTIAAAYLFKKECPHPVDICVNSDSDLLLDLVAQYDLRIIKRPIELALDNSPKLSAIRHSLDFMENTLLKSYEIIIDLDITSPFRKTADINAGLDKILSDANLDVVFSVVPARRSPYFNMVEKKDGRMQKVINACIEARQQSPEVFDMNASVYCYRRAGLLQRLAKSPTQGAFDIFLMKDTGVLDIDSEDDFVLMEILAQHFFKNEFKELYDYTKSLS